jgi:hypothetical protein
MLRNIQGERESNSFVSHEAEDILLTLNSFVSHEAEDIRLTLKNALERASKKPEPVYSNTQRGKIALEGASTKLGLESFDSALTFASARAGRPRATRRSRACKT